MMRILFVASCLASALTAQAADSRFIAPGVVISDRHGLVLSKDAFQQARATRISFEAPHYEFSRNVDPDFIIYIPTETPGIYSKALWIPKTFYPAPGARSTDWSHSHDLEHQWWDDDESDVIDYEAYAWLGGGLFPPPSNNYPKNWVPPIGYVVARIFPPSYSDQMIVDWREKGLAACNAQDEIAFFNLVRQWPIAHSVDIGVYGEGFLSAEFARQSTADALFFLPQTKLLAPLRIGCAAGQLGFAIDDLARAKTAAQRTGAILTLAMMSLDIHLSVRQVRPKLGFFPQTRLPERQRFLELAGEAKATALPLEDGGDVLIFPNDAVVFESIPASAPSITPLEALEERISALPAEQQKYVRALPEYQELVQSKVPMRWMAADPAITDIASCPDINGVRTILINPRLAHPYAGISIFHILFHEELHYQLIVNRIYRTLITWRAWKGITAPEFMEVNLERFLRHETYVNWREARLTSNLITEGMDLIPELSKSAVFTVAQNSAVPVATRYKTIMTFLADNGYRDLYTRKIMKAMDELAKAGKPLDSLDGTPMWEIGH